ncbi:MAG: hypothetical protein QG577_2886 [Thermodesulfobacteriota bacterium]|nr:hypothetical protein [Thermodesulfobacteriota bacterium]
MVREHLFMKNQVSGKNDNYIETHSTSFFLNREVIDFTVVRR